MDICFLLVGIALMNQINARDAAIRQIEEKGGNVWYVQGTDMQQVEMLKFQGPLFKADDVRLVEHFPEVYKVSFSSVALPQEAYRHLLLCPGLKSVSLFKVDRTSVRPALAACAELRRLIEVQVSDTLAEPSDLDHLQHLTRLERLLLSDTLADDSIMKFVGRMRGLTYLSLINTPVGDDGVAEISNLSKLEHLLLRGTRITDRSMAVIAGLTTLKALTLGGTAVSDEGARHLTGLTRLNHLEIDDTAITDDGMRYVASLNKLENLDVMDTAITVAGIRHLLPRDPLPRIVIEDEKMTRANAKRIWLENQALLRKQRNDDRIPREDDPAPPE